MTIALNPIKAEECLPIIDAFEKEIVIKDNIIQRQLKYAELLEKQREEAYKLAEKGVSTPIPFWVWATFGAAAGVTILCTTGHCAK